MAPKRKPDRTLLLWFLAVNAMAVLLWFVVMGTHPGAEVRRAQEATVAPAARLTVSRVPTLPGLP